MESYELFRKSKLLTFNADFFLIDISSIVASRYLSRSYFEMVKMKRIVKTMIVPTISVIKLGILSSTSDKLLYPMPLVF